MVSIAICDDEKRFLEEEKQLILKYFNNKECMCCIDTFFSGEEILALGKEVTKYDIVFLDVNMKEMDGLKTAKKIRELNKKVFLVFVTAFIKYSPEGYKVDATRFLIKGEGNLEFAINECLNAIYGKMQTTEWKHIFHFREGTLELNVNDIVYISSYLRQINFALAEHERTYTMYEKLDTMDKLLADKGFLRLHKSFLVNQYYIKDIRHYEAKLYNGEIISISKPRYIEVRNQFLAFQGGL